MPSSLFSAEVINCTSEIFGQTSELIDRDLQRLLIALRTDLGVN
jgi:hypothetical protein